MEKKVPDISHYQPVKDWNLIKNNAEFLISKATQGTNFVDSTLDSFIKGCEANAIPYWLYTYLNKGNEKAQAEYMVETCKEKVGENFIGYILDVEAKNTAENVKAALDYLNSLGVKTMIYTMYAEYSIYKLVAAVMRGTYGTGDARKEALGERYTDVQEMINHIATAGITTLVTEVLEGKYGNADIRKTVLGSRYAEVQEMVNKENEKITDGEAGY